MVYWIEFEKQKGIRENAGSSLVSARKYAASVLSSGRYGRFADIYVSKKDRIPCGWVGYFSDGKGVKELTWTTAPIRSKSYTYRMYMNGKLKAGSGVAI